jgi:hypothetical protein
VITTSLPTSTTPSPTSTSTSSSPTCSSSTRSASGCRLSTLHQLSTQPACLRSRRLPPSVLGLLLLPTTAMLLPLSALASDPTRIALLSSTVCSSSSPYYKSMFTNDCSGQARNQGNYGNYDDGFHAFSHQIPAYPTQPSYNMQPWAHGQQMPQQMYRGYYPNVTASGSPMNYGAGGYYPPSTYSSSYGGGYGPATTTAGYAASRNYTSNAGQSFGLHHPSSYAGNSSYSSGPAYPNAYGNAQYTSSAPGGYYGTAGGRGNGSSGAYSGGNTATSGGRPNTGADGNLMNAMQNMSFGN